MGGSWVTLWACEDLLLLMVALWPWGSWRRVLDIRSVDQLPVKAQVQADTVVAYTSNTRTKCTQDSTGGGFTYFIHSMAKETAQAAKQQLRQLLLTDGEKSNRDL